MVKRLKLSKEAALELGEYLKDRSEVELYKAPEDMDISAAVLHKKGREIIAKAGGHV
jgi:hypothetical protein